MRIHFTKMHGCANDYIYVNCLDGIPFEPGRLSALMSPRHFSVGADGLVLICRSETADAKMRMFNLDGSEGKMCGNAIRCVGKYLYDNGLTDKTELDIETLSGIKHLSLSVTEGKASLVTVDMGYAVLRAAEIPVVSESETVIGSPLSVCGTEYRITCVSMGNPHAVTFVPDTDTLDLEKIGPVFEHHPMFPERVNTEFIEILDRSNLKMRVWERGSGETWACGTGACAVVASSVKNGIVDPATPITVKLRGGELVITCTADYQIEMCGPAATVYEGVYEYEDSNQ